MVYRLRDFLASISFFFIFAPLLIIIFGVSVYKIGFPIIFKQKRPGLNGRIFNFYKFRTMTDKKDFNNKLLDDEFRMTRFGNWLRQTSLDELPSFFNVLNGNMSLVGPRPLLEEYLPLYTKEQAIRHDVKPGITGWAQINGRNAISWEKKFELDTWYVNNKTFWLDIKIIFITVWKVLKKEGISHNHLSIMPKFKGTDNE